MQENIDNIIKLAWCDKTSFEKQLSKKVTLLDKQLQLLHGDKYNAEDVEDL